MTLALGYSIAYFFVRIWVLILEAQVLKLCLYGKQPQAVCKRSVYVERFAGYLVLLVGRHGVEGAHVVQTIGHLYEYHPDVVAHGEQQLSEILGLG